MSSKTCQLGSQDEAKVVVRIPHLFVGFFAEEPKVNPFYGSIKLESEAWINEFCDFDRKMALTINKCDFSYFMAVTAPEANATMFRTLCDWGNWVFPYDDMFDNGVLRNDPISARKVMDDLMRPLLQGGLSGGSLEGRTSILKVHDHVWCNIQSFSSIGTQRRFAECMADYCTGALMQVEDSCNRNVLTPEDMLARRQLSAGVSPIYPLFEYACELRLPDHIFDHRIIKELEQLVTDFVLIINDMLSYMKEEAELVPHNLVAVARMNGLGPQEAFDYIGQMLDSRHSRWEQAIKSVPSWGHEIDCQVLKYIQGISNVAKANLYWSFKSQRYLGSKGPEIRQTRLVEVLREPSFLQNVSDVEASPGNTSKNLSLPQESRRIGKALLNGAFAISLVMFLFHVATTIGWERRL